MSLRKRLLLLLVAFAIFAVIAASAMIYAQKRRIADTVDVFQEMVGESMAMDRLHVLLSKQLLHLRQIIDDVGGSPTDYALERADFVRGLVQASRHEFGAQDSREHAEAASLTRRYEELTDQCLVLVAEGQSAKADDILRSQIEGEVEPGIRAHLSALQRQVSSQRDEAAQRLASTSSLAFYATAVVALLGIVLVIVGAELIHRWLLIPVAKLKQASQAYRSGDLSHRIELPRDDELAALGRTVSDMARSLAASESKYRSLFANLRDAVVLCDEQLRVTECHDGDTQLLGVSAAAAVGKPLLDIWPEWRAARVDWAAAVQDVTSRGRRLRLFDVELGHLDKSGRPLVVDLLISAVEYAGERHVAIMLRDVTERAVLDRKLRRARTMQAVGTMAGGLAHDVNNLLTSAASTLSTVTDELGDSGQGVQLSSALRSCRRAAGLCRRLLNFAEGEHGASQQFSPASMVRTILESLESDFLTGIELVTSLECSANVNMDPDQFAQVVLNLVRNAREAMPDGGRLDLDLREVDSSDPDDPSRTRPYVRLTCSDSGQGMSPDVEQRIFEPFFTTKSRAERTGRGMGLAVVFAAVNHARGFIQVNSAPGKGATFEVYLPSCGT